jgi:hypothetical protein
VSGSSSPTRSRSCWERRRERRARHRLLRLKAELDDHARVARHLGLDFERPIQSLGDGYPENAIAWVGKITERLLSRHSVYLLFVRQRGLRSEYTELLLSRDTRYVLAILEATGRAYPGPI